MKVLEFRDHHAIGIIKALVFPDSGRHVALVSIGAFASPEEAAEAVREYCERKRAGEAERKADELREGARG